MSNYNQQNVCEGDYIKIRGYDEFFKVDCVHNDRVDCHNDGYWSETGAYFNEIEELRLNDEVPGTNFN